MSIPHPPPNTTSRIGKEKCRRGGGRCDRVPSGPEYLHYRVSYHGTWHTCMYMGKLALPRKRSERAWPRVGRNLRIHPGRTRASDQREVVLIPPSAVFLSPHVLAAPTWAAQGCGHHHQPGQPNVERGPLGRRSTSLCVRISSEACQSVRASLTTQLLVLAISSGFEDANCGDLIVTRCGDVDVVATRTGGSNVPIKVRPFRVGARPGQAGRRRRLVLEDRRSILQTARPLRESLASGCDRGPLLLAPSDVTQKLVGLDMPSWSCRRCARLEQ